MINFPPKFQLIHTEEKRKIKMAIIRVKELFLIC